MAPTEASILSKFLLSPAPLPTAISLQQFTELFPKRLRAHPHIRVLYRELQQVREQDMDLVNENIDKELRQSELQKAELRKSLMRTGVDGMSMDDQREMDMDVQLFGQASSAGPGDYHSASSLLSSMEAACSSIEQEMDEVEKGATAIVSQLNTTVGELSDLRYGKMRASVGATDEEVVQEAISDQMPSIPLHPRASVTRSAADNPLPQLLQTPSGLALLELQGTINLPENEIDFEEPNSGSGTSTTFETPVGKLMFPDYSPQTTAPDDTEWMKRVYLYVGRYQRMTGEVKKLPNPFAVVQRRQPQAESHNARNAADGISEELEIVEIVKFKIIFKNRPEPVNDN
ncbi:hypothetical protein P168DRAFT_298382 [Aspergillus campestris IBT 28561]|uniref:Ctf8-domain-containing protein n=1 Tax=Aspergillus campestris (strain IBT 28561) TaxID=1392248 RepID=A0A2I1CYF7_ASPC2|nr:uncharacterized protein P168DRAFT_298382 [Aspergillus campestris IBT 28561]PKY02644.1 hypothetical protein P168DRAFT_298382 [Aspergillus campestris IBT 28561]